MKTNVTSFMNSPGGTTRRSLGDEEFDGIDDFGEDEFPHNNYINVYIMLSIIVDRYLTQTLSSLLY